MSSAVRAPLIPGQLSPWREVPPQIDRPEYVGKREPRRSTRIVQTFVSLASAKAGANANAITIHFMRPILTTPFEVRQSLGASR